MHWRRLIIPKKPFRNLREKEIKEVRNEGERGREQGRSQSAFARQIEYIKHSRSYQGNCETRGTVECSPWTEESTK